MHWIATRIPPSKRNAPNCRTQCTIPCTIEIGLPPVRCSSGYTYCPATAEPSFVLAFDERLGMRGRRTPFLGKPCCTIARLADTATCVRLSLIYFLHTSQLDIRTKLRETDSDESCKGVSFAYPRAQRGFKRENVPTHSFTQSTFDMQTCFFQLLWSPSTEEEELTLLHNLHAR